MKDTTTKGQDAPQPGGTGSSVSEGLASTEGLRRSEATGGAFRETRLGWSVLAVVWVISATYLGLQLHHGWVPSDAGELAEMANRVLHGQVPAKDFGETYTGGLAYLNALAFRLFGVNFFSLRIPLFIFFLGWVPSVYLIARRFTRPITAGAGTLLAVAWSVPNYPEAMPSWYNLFFATWGTLALLRYTEIEKKRWLWIAGLCAGLSFLVKIVGLYFIAAALLFFVFREQSLSKAGLGRKPRRSATYRLFSSVGLISYAAAVFILISQRPSFDDYVRLVLPSAALVFFLLWETWRPSHASNLHRFRTLLSMVAPFLAGALVPVIVFLLWYVHSMALTAWLKGTFVRSSAHLQWGAANPVPVAVVVGLVPPAIVLILAGREETSLRNLGRYGSPLALLGLLVLAWSAPLAFLFLGDSLPLLIPLIAVVLALSPRFRMRRQSLRCQETFLVVAAGVCCSLIRFPAPAPLYLNYVAPLVILASLSLLTCWPRGDRVALGSLLTFYLAFAVFLRTPGYFLANRAQTDRHITFRKLQPPRAGGILAKTREAEEYEKLVRLIQRHSRGPYIYCTPDCPEVYFLSGKLNPTPTIYEFMDRNFPDLAINTVPILDTLRDRGVTVVALNHSPTVESGPIPAGLKAALRKRFPDWRRVGNFEIRWRPVSEKRRAEPHSPLPGPRRGTGERLLGKRHQRTPVASIKPGPSSGEASQRQSGSRGSGTRRPPVAWPEQKESPAGAIGSTPAADEQGTNSLPKRRPEVVAVMPAYNASKTLRITYQDIPRQNRTAWSHSTRERSRARTTTSQHVYGETCSARSPAACYAGAGRRVERIAPRSQKQTAPHSARNRL